MSEGVAQKWRHGFREEGVKGFVRKAICNKTHYDGVRGSNIVQNVVTSLMDDP